MEPVVSLESKSALTVEVRVDEKKMMNYMSFPLDT